MIKTKQYALPILAIVASIVIMSIPSAQADYHDPRSIAELEQAIARSEGKIAQLQETKASALEMVEHRLASIATLQATIDTLDAIVESGGVLTPDQVVLYNASVAEITHLEELNVKSYERISSYSSSIRKHQGIIATIQAIIDSR